MSLRDSFDTKKTNRPREFVVEDYLKTQVESIGGKCYKFVSPGYSGMPDRIVLYSGFVVFAECKRPGAKPRALQEKRHQEIRKCGVPVLCVSKKADVDRLIEVLLKNG